MFHYSFLIFIFSFLCISINGFAQDKTYTEEEIKAQTLLIEAKKQVLLDNMDKAIEIYTKLYEEFNEDLAAFELSKLHASKEDFILAESYAEKAYLSDVENEWFMLHYANMLSINRNYSGSAKLFEKFASDNPNNELYHLNASFYFMKTGDSKKALNILNKYERRNGLREEVSQRKFEILDSLGKEKDALKELQALSVAYPNETRYIHNLANYMRSLGKDREASKLMNDILKIDPNDETALLFTKSSGNNKDADYIRTLLPVVRDERINIDKKIIALIPYIQDFADKGNPELGESLLDITDELNINYPNNPKILSIKGDLLFYGAKFSEASLAYEASTLQDPSVWLVWNQMLLSDHFDGNYVRLQNNSLKALDVYPNQSTAYFFNALANIEIGNIEEAGFAIDEAIMIGGADVRLMLDIEWLNSKIDLIKGNNEAAEKRLSKCMAAYPENPDYLEQYGDILFEMKRGKEALEYWMKAQSLGRKTESLSNKIKNVLNYDN